MTSCSWYVIFENCPLIFSATMQKFSTEQKNHLRNFSRDNQESPTQCSSTTTKTGAFRKEIKKDVVTHYYLTPSLRLTPPPKRMIFPSSFSVPLHTQRPTSSFAKNDVNDDNVIAATAGTNAMNETIFVHAEAGVGGGGRVHLNVYFILGWEWRSLKLGCNAA